MSKRLLTKRTHAMPKHVHTFHTRKGEVTMTWTLRNWTVGFWWFRTQKSRFSQAKPVSPEEWKANPFNFPIPPMRPQPGDKVTIYSLLRAGVDLGPLEFVYRETI